MNYKVLVVASILFLFPVTAYAEVSDKVPSILRLWGTGILLGVIGFLAIQYRKWAGAIVAVVAIFFCYIHHGIIVDEFVGPAVIKEQGSKYIISVYGSIGVMILPLIIGMFFNRKKQ